MHQGIGDGFDTYRRERERLRRMGIQDQKRPLSGPVNALEELEAVERREERDRQLNQEMQDFLQSATLVAADIVQKVASTAKLEIDERLSLEMEDFLRESITRVQTLVHAVLARNSASTAEQVIEPLMHNLVGSLLDGFRQAGTAGADKHLGKDPMDTSLEAVREELLAMLPGQQGPAAELESGSATPATDADAPAAEAAPQHDIEEHLVAQMHREQAPKSADAAGDLDRFQKALQKLVKKGQMTQEEADAALAVRQQRS